MKRHLVIVERIINLNTYQRKQALYRNYEPITGLHWPAAGVFILVVVPYSNK